MAKVSLRNYNREIETLIDRAHIEEAADHCKHILQAYPKHLETYRLLGKALLESQRFGESADIFERVLASIPDDFFSHVGMSIIREDENNLDRAIWHMERAFEAQPANTVVQNELRRLFTRRDGVEPPRIRLTRGALARMYARGDLYQQAIAELRAALAEDPNRVDLRVLLARMCFLSGQKVEATQICGDLLSKSPYNYEANRILAEILPGTSRAEDAKVYRQRMVALDPYAAFTSLDTPHPTDVADITVMVEHLEWSTTTVSREAEQPQWASSLGIRMADTSAPAKIPDWIQNMGSAGAADAAPLAAAAAAPVPVAQAGAGRAGPIETPQAVQPTGSAQPGIPDWMKVAGWAPAAPGSEEQPGPAFADAGEPSEDGSLAPAEIPAWLKAMAPANQLEEDEGARDKAFEDLFGSVTPAAATAARPAAAVDSGQSLMPAWLKDMDSSTAAAEPTPAVPAQAVPAGASTQPDSSLDWLNELQSTEETQTDSSLPDWLSTLDEPAPAQTSALEQNAPADLNAAAEKTLPGFMAPGWLREFAEPQSQAESPAPTEAPAPETAPSFAEELAPAELPDWLSGLEPSIVEVPPTPAATAAVAAVAASDELPDWLSELGAPVEAAPAVSAVEAPAVEPSFTEELAPAELPDWLSALQPPATQEPAAIQAVAVPTPQEPTSTELPGWLSEIDMPGLQTETSPAVSNPEPVLMPAEMALSQSEEDAALAWLEGLAAKQGADEQVLFVKPEDRTAEPPAWVTAEMEQPEAVPANAEITAMPEAAAPALAEVAVSGPSGPAEPAAEELPDWLKEIETPAFGAAGLASAAAEELPPTLVPEAQAAPEAAPAGLITEDIPDWLQEMETPQPQAAVQAAVQTPAAESSAAELSTMGALSQSEEDAALAWLESLATKQGADEQVLFVKPEDRTAEPPAWVTADMETAAVEPGLAVEPELAEIPAAELETATLTIDKTEALPDWLAELETPASAEAAAEAVPAAASVESIEGESLAPAELPDWLSEIGAPAALSVESSETPLSQTEEDAALAWLEGLAAKQGADEQVLFVKPEDRTAEPPAWVSALAGEPAGAVQPLAEPASVEPSLVEELPDWLMEIEAPAAELPPTLVPEAQVVETAQAPAGLITEELPDWLLEIETPAAAAKEAAVEGSLGAPEGAALSQSEEDAALAWLEGLAAKQGADEQVLFVKPEERTAEPPAWVQASVELAAAESSSAPVPVELPVSAVEPTAVPADARAEKIPDWLAEIETPTAQSAAEFAPTPAAAADVPLSQTEEDAALAWLEGLAAKQGADEQVLFVKPEERTAEPPAWVQASVELAAAESISTPVPVELPVNVVEPAGVMGDEIPDWLAEIETPAAEAPAAEIPAAGTEPGVDGWLQEIAAETARIPVEPAVTTPAFTEEVPTWLAEMEAAEAPTKVTSRAELNRAIADITARNQALTAAEIPAPAEIPVVAQLPAAQPGPKVPVEVPGPVQAVPSEPAPAVSVSVQPAATSQPAPAGPEALSAAQSALAEGQVEQAVNGYLALISTGSLVDEVVHDLREALYHYPVDISIWQALGDALLRANRIQEALDAYTKAEDLLR